MWINIIYFCTDSPFVPTDFKPIIFGSENFYKQVSVKCPLISNPSPVCTWSKYDANNTKHEVVPGKYIGYDAGFNNCSLGFFPLREEHSGLYECTASNTIGSATYTFPERFIVESKELYGAMNCNNALCNSLLVQCVYLFHFYNIIDSRTLKKTGYMGTQNLLKFSKHFIAMNFQMFNWQCKLQEILRYYGLQYDEA